MAFPIYDRNTTYYYDDPRESSPLHESASWTTGSQWSSSMIESCDLNTGENGYYPVTSVTQSTHTGNVFTVRATNESGSAQANLLPTTKVMVSQSNGWEEVEARLLSGSGQTIMTAWGKVTSSEAGWDADVTDHATWNIVTSGSGHFFLGDLLIKHS